MPNSGTTANYGLIPNPDGAFGLQATQEPRIDADTMLPELDSRYEVSTVASPVEATLQNDWVNPLSDRKASYYKDRGRVYLSGVVTGDTVATTMFTLPAGYRPPAATGVNLVTMCSDGVSTITVAVLQVSSNGNVSAVYMPEDLVGLDGASFLL